MTKKIEVRGPDGNVIGLVTEFKPSVHHPGGTDVTAAIYPEFRKYIVGNHSSMSMGAKVEEPVCLLCAQGDVPHAGHRRFGPRDIDLSKGTKGEITFISASIDMAPEAFGAPKGTEGYLDGEPVAFEKVTHIKLERRVRDGFRTACGKTISTRKRRLDTAVGLDDLDHVTCPKCLERHAKEKP
jgi:hypothetical protein